VIDISWNLQSMPLVFQAVEYQIGRRRASASWVERGRPHA
jgi:hypothetical protein